MTNLWLVWFVRLRRSRKALGDRKGRPYAAPCSYKKLRKLGADNWACLCYNNKTYNFYR